MSTIPPAFSQVQKLAGYSDSETDKRWGDIFESTAKDIISWLQADPLLSDIQKNRLTERSEKIKVQSRGATFFVELDPVLEENQRVVVARKYAEVFRSHLTSSIKEATDKCSPEQKQVLETYTQTQKI